MENRNTLQATRFAQFVCLTILGKSVADCKRMLGLKQKEIDEFNGSAGNDPCMKLDISKSEKVRGGKYAAYLTDDDKVILINRQYVYFVDKLDGEIKVSK